MHGSSASEIATPTHWHCHGIVWRYDDVGKAQCGKHISGSTQRLGCTANMSPMMKLELSWWLFYTDWMLLKYTVTPWNPPDPVTQTCYQHHMSTTEATGCRPISSLIQRKRLHFFGHKEGHRSHAQHGDVSSAWQHYPCLIYPCGE